MTKSDYPPDEIPITMSCYQPLTIRLHFDVHERIREIAFKHRSQSAIVIRELIQEGIKKYDDHMETLKDEEYN